MVMQHSRSSGELDSSLQYLPVRSLLSARRELTAQVGLSAAGSWARETAWLQMQRITQELDGRSLFEASYPGREQMISDARHEVQQYLGGWSRADDGVMAVSELATNAVLHSASRGGTFTVRAEIYCGGIYCCIEVEDAGGVWRGRHGGDDGRPHGLDIIRLMGWTWGIDNVVNTRIVWAMLEPEQP